MPNADRIDSHSTRTSSIELLKILAIFLIIISHMTQTLTAYSTTAKEQIADYVINLEEFAMTNPGASFFMYLFKQFGQLGNHIFFVCSAWFLTDSKKSYGKKIANMLAETWVVSVVILLAVALTKAVDLNGSTILRCLLPSTFSNNWYVTYYVLFLALVPFLNYLLNHLTQKQHLLFTLFILIIRIFVDPFTIEWSNSTIGLSIDKWIILFFLIAYMKRYLPRFSSNVWANLLLLIIGLVVYILEALISTYGYKGSTLTVILTAGWSYKSIYLYAIAISLFNLFRRMHFHSQFVNQISKYSLLIYIIHENILIRKCIRPIPLKYIYEHYGYENIVIWILAVSLMTFICSGLLATVFKVSISKLSEKFVDKYYAKFRALCSSVLGKLTTVQ